MVSFTLANPIYLKRHTKKFNNRNRLIMKKYIGTKSVEAMPMTLGGFFKRTGRHPYANDPDAHSNDEAGYLVKYEDGYESWSSKDVFEKAYKASETYADRLLIEKAELEDRLQKCESFVNSEKFREVVKDEYQSSLLQLQLQSMCEYYNILVHRLFADDSDLLPLSMSFGMAIQALKFGLAIRRNGWNGKNLMVFKQVPAHIEGDIIPKMQSLPQSAKGLIGKGKNFIDYTSQCLIYNRETGMADSWVPSISDVFAEDWELVME